MGGKGIEFEVERRREDRTLSSPGKDEARRPSKVKKKEEKKEGEGEGPAAGAEDRSWTAYFEDPKTVDNMKFFVMAQSFVMFLTFGLPQLQKLFSLIQESFFS